MFKISIRSIEEKFEGTVLETIVMKTNCLLKGRCTPAQWYYLNNNKGTLLKDYKNKK